MYKSSQFIVMSLLLLTTALLIGCVSNESVNKDNSVSPAPPPPPQLSPVAHAHDIIIDHSDLPTKFGDEDDVIEGKTASEKKTSDTIGGIGSSSSKDGKFRNDKSILVFFFYYYFHPCLDMRS